MGRAYWLPQVPQIVSHTAPSGQRLPAVVPEVDAGVGGEVVAVTLPQRTCRFCHHSWYPRKPEPPKKCPRCQRGYVEAVHAEGIVEKWGNNK